MFVFSFLFFKTNTSNLLTENFNSFFLIFSFLNTYSILSYQQIWWLERKKAIMKKSDFPLGVSIYPTNMVTQWVQPSFHNPKPFLLDPFICCQDEFIFRFEKKVATKSVLKSQQFSQTFKQPIMHIFFSFQKISYFNFTKVFCKVFCFLSL